MKCTSSSWTQMVRTRLPSPRAPASSTSCRSGVATARRCTLSGPSDADLSKSLRRRWWVAGDGAVVVRPAIPGSRRSPRPHRRLFSARERGLTGIATTRSRDRNRRRVSVCPVRAAILAQNGQRIAGESRHHAVLMCESESTRCRPLTPTSDRGLTALAWSGDGARLFFLRHTSARIWGELTSVSVDGSAVKVHGLVGPFESDFQMSMDVSPRGEILFAICREGPQELWAARLR